MSAPSPNRKREIARERAQADGRLPQPQDRRSKRSAYEMTPEEAQAARLEEAREAFEKRDLTPVGDIEHTIEYDDEQWTVNFVKYDTWKPRTKKGELAVEVEQPDPDVELDENTVMLEVEKAILDVMDDDEYERAVEFCEEKYGYPSKRWFMGLHREIRRHPALGE